MNKMSLQNTPDAWWKTDKIFNFRECLCAWCTICTSIFSIFCVQILFWCWFSATIIHIVPWISIPVTKECVQFVLQISIFNFSSEEPFVCKICFSIFHLSSQKAFLCTVCLSIFNFNGEEAFVCTVCISNFNFQFQRRGGRGSVRWGGGGWHH